MYRYVKNIRNNFKNYHLKGNQLLTVFLDETDDTVIRLYDASTSIIEKEINLGTKTFNIFFYPEQDILAYFPLKKLLRVSIKTEEVSSSIEVNFAPELLIKNTLYGISIDENLNKLTSKLDVNTNEIKVLIKEPFRLWGHNSKDIYGVKVGQGQEIYSINTKNGSFNWSYNFDTELSGKLLFYCNQVLVIGRSKIYALDVDTGTLLWSKAPTNDRIKLYGDKLINIDAACYREYSIETGQILIEVPMKTEYEKYGFRFMGINSNFTITDTHVFIVDAMNDMLGAVCRTSGKIDWSVQVGEGKITLPNAPIVGDCMLYVLDEEGTLHIFEKE